MFCGCVVRACVRVRVCAKSPKAHGKVARGYIHCWRESSWRMSESSTVKRLPARITCVHSLSNAQQSVIYASGKKLLARHCKNRYRYIALQVPVCRTEIDLAGRRTSLANGHRACRGCINSAPLPCQTITTLFLYPNSRNFSLSLFEQTPRPCPPYGTLLPAPPPRLRESRWRVKSRMTLPPMHTHTHTHTNTLQHTQTPTHTNTHHGTRHNTKLKWLPQKKHFSNDPSLLLSLHRSRPPSQPALTATPPPPHGVSP